MNILKVKPNVKEEAQSESDYNESNSSISKLPLLSRIEKNTI